MVRAADDRLGPQSNVLSNFLEQQEAWQRRINNQRKTINRYDGFRRWVLDVLVPELDVWEAEMKAAGMDIAAGQVGAMAARTRVLGENPPEEWA